MRDVELTELTEPVIEVHLDDAFNDIALWLSEPAPVAEDSGPEGSQLVAAVMERDQLLGIITASDVARRNGLSPADRGLLCARDVMNTAFETLAATTPIIEAADWMRERRAQYTALIDDTGRFVGLVSLRRVLSYAMDQLGLKIDNLERELMADGPGG